MRSLALLLTMAALGGTLFAAPASSKEPFCVYGSPLPPYVLEQDAGRLGGIAIDILTGAMDQAGIPYVIMPQMPWRRAQHEAAKADCAVLAPYIRTPLREPEWQWIGQLFEDPLVGVTRAGTAPPAKLEDLRSFPRIGVIAGGASESLLRGMGLADHIETTTTNDLNLAKLLSGHIDIWLLHRYEALWWITQITAPQRPELNPLATLEAQTQWAAASLTMPAEAITRLREALARFRKTPEYTVILAKYADPP